MLLHNKGRINATFGWYQLENKSQEYPGEAFCFAPLPFGVGGDPA
jgi:hypothetical protein